MPLPRNPVDKGRRKNGSLTHWDFARGLGLLAHHQQQTIPPGGWLRLRRHPPRQLRAGLGSDLRCPRDTPAASSLLCCPHLVPTYPPRPLPRPSRCACGLLGSSSSCPKMNEAELSPQVSCVSTFYFQHIMLLLEVQAHPPNGLSMNYLCRY